MAEVKWIKIVTDIFDDEKIILIESMPEGYSIIVAWFKLLCMAGRVNRDGFLLMNDKVAYTEEMLSHIFRMPLTIIRLSLEVFSRFGMVEIVNNTITIPNWNKHQNLDGMDRIREQNRIRQAAYREKVKELPDNVTNNVTHNVTVTHSNALDIEEDIDSRKKYIKKEPDIVLPYDSDEFKATWSAYLEVRNKKKSPNTGHALKLAIGVIEKNATTEQGAIDILNQSIFRGYTGLFPVKEQYDQAPKKEVYL